MSADAAGPDGSALSEGLGTLVVNGVTFEPLRIPVPQIARGLPKELHVFSREMVLAMLAAERERERERMRATIADDAYAATFQTLGQYRSALLRAFWRA